MTIISTLPPEPNDIAPDPAYFQQVAFVAFDPAGRITSRGDTALAYYRQKQIQGERVALGSGHWDTHYVDASDSTPVVRARPVLKLDFDTVVLRPRQEAVMRECPPAEISFTGPVNGTQDHSAGGDLSIGWTVPGDYLVTIKAFPHLDTTIIFTVEKAS